MMFRNAVAIFVVAVFATTAPAATADGEALVLDSFFKPYLTIQTSLAGDDLAKAKAGAVRLGEAIRSADGTTEISAGLEISARLIGEAPDIDSARRGFRDLSHQMMQLVNETETAPGMTLYVAHCPMAFSGEGGTWIQADKTVANPYYGAGMLRCGSVQRQLTGERDETQGSAGKHHDSSHQH